MKNLNKMKIAGDMQFEIGQDKVSHFPSMDVKDDETLLNKLLAMKRSTFDLSKFTVVGSPTITDDGVASGFSTSNYLQIPIYITNSSLFSIDIEVDTRVGTGSGWVYSNPGIATNLCIWTDSNAKNFSFHFGQVSLKSVNVDYNSKYSLHFSRESETAFKIKVVDVISKEIKYDNTITAQIENTFNVNKLSIGYSSTGSLGSIDLNSFKIYVDGNLVYQPCLKIPYTESKTGSKIVNAIYRDRVQDMYEQYGYTHYYTLGDTDFTLATCKGSDVVESGDNYEQTADLTLKQWGSATNGQTVNLLPYKDTNYAVTLANGSKTKSSFVANATGDYFAVGKTVLV